MTSRMSEGSATNHLAPREQIERIFPLRLGAAALALLAGACQCGDPCNPALAEEDQPESCFDAGPPAQPDYCNSAQEGLTDSTHCILPLSCGIDGGKTDVYINPPTDGGADEDWYSAEFGALTPRSLLKVSAGYLVPSTPVELSVAILKSNAMFSLGRVVDVHGQGAPRPVEFLIPYTESNSKLLFLVSDKGGRTPPVYDLRSPYYISVCTQEDPDINEPNDTPDAGATPINLPTGGAVLTGSNTGYLATDNDVDRFVVNVPANMPTARNIFHLRITTAEELMPPPPFRLSYTLLDPSGVQISEGVVGNAFLKVDLSTARLIRQPGPYTVVVQGFKPGGPSDPTLVKGDLRLKYTVDIQIMGDLDTNEGNDSMGEAAPKARMFTPGSSVSLKGRISYRPDPEWFAFDLPPNSDASTLHVRLRSSTTAGRFAPLEGPVDRQLRVMFPVPAPSTLDSVNRCLTSTASCPKGYDPQDQAQQNLVSQICTGFTDGGSAQCLMLERNESLYSAFQNMKNMEGIIPVPAHPSTSQRYWVVVQDDGNNWADDTEWTLDVSLDADPDEARFASGALASSINGSVSGVLTHGYGRTAEYNLGDCQEMPETCRGVRSPNDYDAVVSDFDQFSFNLGAGVDQSWGLSWEIDKVNGQLPANLRLDLAFCGQTLADGGCSIITGTNYQTGTFSPWYSDQREDRVVGWKRDDLGTKVRITAELNQCLCLQRSFTRLVTSIGLVDRDFYAPINYSMTQSTGAWGGTFDPRDGGTTSFCSQGWRPGPDGGAPACGLP